MTSQLVTDRTACTLLALHGLLEEKHSSVTRQVSVALLDMADS